MNYTLKQLQTFVKLAENQSITKTAQEIYLTQPAVSLQLKKLQNQFSIPLTEVVGRQLYITEFGYEIAKSAQKILNEMEAINYKTNAFEGKLSGKLKITIVSTAKYVLPYFLSDFMGAHPGIDLIIDVTNKASVMNSLEVNKVDLALVSVLPDNLNLERVELLQNKLFLVGGTVLKRKPKQSVKDLLKNNALLFREKGSATRSAMETFLESKKLIGLKNIELQSNEALKQAVIAGLGYSIMPLIGIKNELKNKDLEIIPVRGLPLITNWNLVWMKAKNLSPVAQALLEYIKLNKDQIINEKFDWFEKY